MSRSKWKQALVLGVAVGVTSAAHAQQQEGPFPNARPVWENAKAGAVATRAPGRMVRRGTVRFRESHGAIIGRALVGPTITDTAPPTKPVNQLKADLLAIIFRDLNLALQLLSQSFIGESGVPPPGTGADGISPPAADVSELLGTVSGPET